jgi:hypothetical protein
MRLAVMNNPLIDGPGKTNKDHVYAFSGFCSALAGLVFSMSLLAGYGHLPPEWNWCYCLSGHRRDSIKWWTGNVIGTLLVC